ncbi:unnamed protein product [Mucor hiemalis]
MELSGVNTKDYQAHLVQAAASAKAAELGHSKQRLLSSQTATSTKITTSISSSSEEKRITLEAEAE